MKEFFKNRSYDMVRMFLNQFAISIFGLVLALAAGQAQNPTLRNITSVAAILFYLFLLYTMTWDLGFKDRAGVENGRLRRAPFTGFWISLCANVPNFLFALFISLGLWFPDVTALSSIGGVATSAALLLEGMFTGLLANRVGGVPLNAQWWVYFVIILPALLACTVAYQLGLKDFRFTRLSDVVYPESDRDPKPRRFFRAKRKSDSDHSDRK